MRIAALIYLSTALSLGSQFSTSPASATPDLDEATEAASVPQSAKPRFVNLGNGIVRDQHTGLEWAEQDNGHGIHWRDARAYCGRLTLGGFSNWLLPEIGQLSQLYDVSQSQPCGRRVRCHLDPTIDMTGSKLWSRTLASDYYAYVLGFVLPPPTGGKRSVAYLRSDSGGGSYSKYRALCVRRPSRPG